MAALQHTSAFAKDRISGIEFFGYKGLDLEAVRKALPVQVGDAASPGVKEKIRNAVKLATGYEPTDVEEICCDSQGDAVLYIGLAGQSSRTFSLNPEPSQRITLSPKIKGLADKMDQAEEAAVRNGASSEEPGKGYRLLKDPEARARELEVRQYALRHEAEVLRVLKSSSSGEQRAIAADVLGYARVSPRQIAALVSASRDVNDEVRNNSTRALGELVAADPSLSTLIPAAGFIDMLLSGNWFDRNKASALLAHLTHTRDPNLLGQLRNRALDALVEMALWRDTSHAYLPRLIVGRIAGIPEERLEQLAGDQPEMIVNALNTNH